MRRNQITLVAAVIVLLALFFAFDLQRYLSLEFLQAQRSAAVE